MSSWVIVNNQSGEGVMETFSKELADKVRAESTTHHVVPILDYLVSINREISDRGIGYE